MKLHLVLLSLFLAAPSAHADAVEQSAIPYQCEDTKIKKIGTRLVDGSGNPVPNSGPTVLFENGVSIVEYQTNDVVDHQRVGDKVQVCLIKVPAHCPEGDDRGREYRVYDYRQKAAYTMINSQHGCGGA